MKKIILGLMGLVFVFGLAGITNAVVNAVTPSTNDANRTHLPLPAWAHVDQTSIGVGTTDLQFISTRAFDSCFEYRTDGDTGQALGTPNPNPAVADNYPAYCQNNDNSTHAITANVYVEVRMVYGAETDERFDWTRFEVNPSPTGSIEIKKYDCPEGTTVNRDDNGTGEGDEAPTGCVASSGKYFGYTHGSQTDAGAPYDDFNNTLVAGGVTNGSGVLTISGLPTDGRYIVFETDATNTKLANEDILGLYCDGDADPNPNHNDNGDITFVPTGGTVQCVAYDIETDVGLTHSISGFKFNDANGDGIWSGEDESALNGVDIKIYRNEELDVLIDTDTTHLQEFQGNGFYSFDELVAGNYLVCEVPPEGTEQTYPNNEDEDDGTIDVNGCYEITISDTGYASNNFGNHQTGEESLLAKLTIVKHMDEESQFEYEEFDFSVEGTGDSDFVESVSLNTEDMNGDNNIISEQIELDPGTYDVFESVPLDWHLADVQCEYDNESFGIALPLPQLGKQITVDDDDVTCTFTNTQRATLIVKKIVINDNEGTLTADDFSFQVNGDNAIQFEQREEDNELSGENHLIFDEEQGPFTVTEPGVSGYTTTYEGCDDVEIGNLGTATCTITNNDIPPVEEENGGNTISGSRRSGSVLGASTEDTQLPDTGKVLGTEKFIFTLFLKMGPPYHFSTWGNEVKELQKFLNGKGYDCGVVDGLFGPKTDACVRAFQKANPPLVVDGIVGPLTRAVLNK